MDETSARSQEGARGRRPRRSREDAAIVVAMDGPSGAGKSSVAREVARVLGLRYLDTGAMYRAMTWWMLRAGVSVGDPAAVASRAVEPALVSGTDPDAPTIALDGEDVSGPIRTREVSNAVSAVASVPDVRSRLVAMQREIIGSGGIVVEGRDIGTVVAPDAPVKIFITASPTVRADRRTKELTGTTVDVTRAEMARRDRLDSTRKVDPLTKASDAIELDTTHLSLDEVVAEVLRIVKEHAVNGPEGASPRSRAHAGAPLGEVAP